MFRFTFPDTDDEPVLCPEAALESNGFSVNSSTPPEGAIHEFAIHTRQLEATHQGFAYAPSSVTALVDALGRVEFGPNDIRKIYPLAVLLGLTILIDRCHKSIQSHGLLFQDAILTLLHHFPNEYPYSRKELQYLLRRGTWGEYPMNVHRLLHEEAQRIANLHLQLQIDL